MTGNIWRERGQKRGGRWWPKLLATLEADETEAEPLGAEQWPELRQEVIENRGDDVWGSPPSGAERRRRTVNAQ